MKQSSDSSQKSLEVFSGSSWEAEMIRSLLDDAQISNFTKNNILNQSMYEPIRSEGAKVIVLEKDFQEAQRIVDEYINNLKR